MTAARWMFAVAGIGLMTSVVVSFVRVMTAELDPEDYLVPTFGDVSAVSNLMIVPALALGIGVAAAVMAWRRKPPREPGPPLPE